MKNSISAMHIESQAKEGLIRALALNDKLHEAADGVVENITGEIVADILLDAALSTGFSHADAVSQVMRANPWDIADALRRFLHDMTAEQGSLGNDGMYHLDMDKIQ